MYKKIQHPERPFVLHIFIGCDPKYIARKLNKEIDREYYYPVEAFATDNDVVATTYDMGGEAAGHIALAIHSPDIPIEFIAHEATHCTSIHFRYIGQMLDSNSEESYAYMVGWITGIVHKMISKK